MGWWFPLIRNKRKNWCWWMFWDCFKTIWRFRLRLANYGSLREISSSEHFSKFEGGSSFSVFFLLGIFPLNSKMTAVFLTGGPSGYPLWHKGGGGKLGAAGCELVDVRWILLWVERSWSCFETDPKVKIEVRKKVQWSQRHEVMSSILQSETTNKWTFNTLQKLFQSELTFHCRLRSP